MTRQSISRSIKISAASLMAVLFGFPGVAMANQASIRNTGPDSYNKIEFNNETTCEVENNNNVHATNHVEQNAQTGDAVVGGSDWHRYDPAAWAASGHSYDEWESAVNSYMAQNKHDWKSKWGGHSGGNTTGGDATSGNASNVSNNRTNISINNNGQCNFGYLNSQQGGQGGSKSGSKPGSVLGSASEVGSRPKNKSGSMLGASTGAASGQSSNIGVTGSHGGFGGQFNPTTSGGAGGGKSPSGQGGLGGSTSNKYSIGNTGPDSINKIEYTQSNHTNVQNTNNVTVLNITKQNATSGNASVSGNTTSGSAGSGGAHNASGNNTGAGIQN